MRTTLLILLVLCVPAVWGIGISHEYLPNKELSLSPGENYLFKLIIQNEEDVPVSINVSLASPVATLVGGGIVEIPAETYNKHVLFNISIPSSAAINDTYQMTYVVAPFSQEEGQVPFSVRYERTILIRVNEGQVPRASTTIDGNVLVEQPQTVQNNWWLWPLLAISILGILTLLWRKSEGFSRQVLRHTKSSGRELVRKPNAQPVAQAQPVVRTQPIIQPAAQTQPAVQGQPVAQTNITPQTTQYAKHSGSEESLARARPEHAFVLSNGDKLFTIKDVVDAARLNPDSCATHVQAGRNDFSAWIRQELCLDALAEKVDKETTITGVVAVLNDALA